MKENILQHFCFQELQDGTGMGLGSFIMEIITYKGRPFSVFVDGFVSHFALLQLYSHFALLQPSPCTVIFEISRSKRMMAAILNLLMRSDQEDGYLKKMCTRSLTAKR